MITYPALARLAVAAFDLLEVLGQQSHPGMVTLGREVPVEARRVRRAVEPHAGVCQARVRLDERRQPGLERRACVGDFASVRVRLCAG